MTPANFRSLLSAATPGPWKASGRGSPDICGPGKFEYVVQGDGQGYGFCSPAAEADAALIVALRNLAPLLVDLWEAAEEYAAPPTGNPAEWAGAALKGRARVRSALDALREAKP